MTKAQKATPTDKLEGEGSYTAGRRYDAALQRFVEESPVETLADAAARALDGPEGAVLRAAERTAKAGHRDRPTKRAKRPQA